MDRAELAKLLGAAGVAAEPRDFVIQERDGQRFVSRFTEAVAAGGTVFLADPDWSERERAQFHAQVECRGGENRDGAGAKRGEGWLCIPTGGSSGDVKLARHDESTLWAAVGGFATHFGISRVNAVGLLPLHHVSGLMAWLRCVLTGGDYLGWCWKRLEAGERPEPPERDAFLSLVPTQLWRLLEQPAAVDWLRRFRAILVGGAPSSRELVERGAELRLPLAFSYGATETAAMAAALRPEDFLAGRRGCGPALPHGRITVGDDGSIVIESVSLFRGYWPAWRAAKPWLTGDAGGFDESGSLHVRGRRDGLIISGGEKIDPQEVEAALRAAGGLGEVAVVGVPDPEWGQVVAVCFPVGAEEPDRRRVEQALDERLAKFKWPKHYVAIASWPVNAAGKIRRAELAVRAGEVLGR